eukprot:31108-Pelagococcus_subviridis.AAC.10
MALNHTAAPNVDVMVFSSGRSAASVRAGWSMRSKYSTMSGLCFFVKRFASPMILELYWMSDADGCSPGVSMRRSVMPCILCSMTRTDLVSASNADAVAESRPSSELIVEDFPTPDFPRRRIVHVNPRSESTPSRRSAASAASTALSNELVCPRPMPAPAAFFPLLSCSASSRR